MPTKVLIIDSSDIVRAGLHGILSAADSIEVIGDTGDCKLARRLITEQQPEVVVLDLGVTDTTSLELIAFLRLKFPETRLLVFTSRDCVATVRKYMAAGVDGYLIKEATGNELIAAVEAVAAGRKIVSITQFGEFYQPNTLDQIETAENEKPPRNENLSERELEVLTGIAHGHTNQQIADKMFLSVKTIETYRSRLSKKIGARNRSDLFAYAQSSGILNEI